MSGTVTHATSVGCAPGYEIVVMPVDHKNCKQENSEKTRKIKAPVTSDCRGLFNDQSYYFDCVKVKKFTMKGIIKKKPKGVDNNPFESGQPRH